jgi:AsmA protein
MKLLIKISIAIFALLALTITLLLIFVDPNDYKSEIETQVKTNLNRDLHIVGDIGWTFYPQLGFSSGEIELDNLSGFSQPHLVKINKASLGINILPLLKGEISIGKLTLDGFELTLLTDKNGLSNLDNMGKKSDESNKPATVKDASPTDETVASEKDEPFFAFNKTQLAGIEINNAIIELQDLQAGSHQKITINEIKLGEFAFDKETEFIINTKLVIDDLQAEIKLNSLLLVNTDMSNIKLSKLQVDTLVTGKVLPNGRLKSVLKTDVDFAVNSKKITLSDFDINTVITADNLPNKKVSTQVNATISYQLDDQLATINALKLKIDQLELAGEVSVQTANITKVRYNLVANKWDLNNYMAKPADKKDSAPADAKANGTSKPSAPSGTVKQEAEVEPDLAFLHDLDIDGHLKIAGVKVDNINIGEINNHLIINKGTANVKLLTAELYQGLLTLNAQVIDNKGRNTYQAISTLKGVQIRPLLIDAAEIDLISGETNFNFKGKGQGLTATKIKQGIVGKGSFSLLDGEIYGVNIPQEIRGLKAKLTGKKAPTEESVKKTDFASLTGEFSINKGLVNNQKFLMLSPIMRLDGSGLVHIIKETLDYKLSISPLSSSKSDTDYIDLNGLTIPMLIKGSFTDPKISLDTDSALKEQLKAKLDVEKKRLQEKAKKELKKHQDKIDVETQDRIKKEGKRLEDKLKKFF